MCVCMCMSVCVCRSGCVCVWECVSERMCLFCSLSYPKATLPCFALILPSCSSYMAALMESFDLSYGATQNMNKMIPLFSCYCSSLSLWNVFIEKCISRVGPCLLSWTIHVLKLSSRNAPLQTFSQDHVYFSTLSNSVPATAGHEEVILSKASYISPSSLPPPLAKRNSGE